MSYEEEKQDRKIEQLEAEIERLRGEMENYGDDYVCQMKSKDSRIKELEDALVDERASRVYYEDSCPFRLWNDIKLKDKFLEKAKWQLQRGGKIRPNAKQHDHTAEFFRPNESPAKSWQITDERKAALSRAYDVISWIDRVDSDNQKHIDVLRDMLEAGQ